MEAASGADTDEGADAQSGRGTHRDAEAQSGAAGTCAGAHAAIGTEVQPAGLGVGSIAGNGERASGCLGGCEPANPNRASRSGVVRKFPSGCPIEALNFLIATRVFAPNMPLMLPDRNFKSTSRF
jgi:hypothetical protein